MSCILHIETSTSVCSVALSQDGAIIFEERDENGPQHAAVLAPYVQEALSFADSHAIPLDAVAVSAGPGSYTGLRIGVSTAKGVCFGRDARLISVPTLEVMCVPVLLYNETLPDDALLCPMIDARRMEVYESVFTRALKPLHPTRATIVEATTFDEYLAAHPVYFFGNGAAKCEAVIKHPNAHFLPDIKPLAKNMVPLAERAVAQERFEDVAYFEPFYLKEFVTSTPRKLL